MSVARSQKIGSAGPVTFDELPVNKVRTHASTQTRVAIDDGVVAEYAEAIRSGATFPPVIVFRDKAGRLWLADGYHRRQAHILAAKSKIACEIHAGELRDAVSYSLTANCRHGLRRSNADKRLAVERALADPEWAQLPVRRLAELCGVSKSFVNKMQIADSVIITVDDCDIKLTGHLVESWKQHEADVERFLAVRDQMRSAIHSLCECQAFDNSDKSFECKDGLQVHSPFDSTADEVIDSMPHCPCPDCVNQPADKPNKRCRCKGRFWLCRKQWKELPELQRKQAIDALLKLPTATAS